MANDYSPKVGDKVKSINTRYDAFTGTVTKIFVGFVRVDFDKPQGPGGMHRFTLTSPTNLELVDKPEDPGIQLWEGHVDPAPEPLPHLEVQEEPQPEKPDDGKAEDNGEKH